MDKTLERLNKGRELHQQKRLMTERGIPSQMKGKIEGKDKEAQFVFSPNSSKFKSGFGNDGSQINSKVVMASGSPNKSIEARRLSGRASNI